MHVGTQSTRPAYNFGEAANTCCSDCSTWAKYRGCASTKKGENLQESRIFSVSSLRRKLSFCSSPPFAFLPSWTSIACWEALWPSGIPSCNWASNWALFWASFSSSLISSDFRRNKSKNERVEEAAILGSTHPIMEMRLRRRDRNADMVTEALSTEAFWSWLRLLNSEPMKSSRLCETLRPWLSILKACITLLGRLTLILRRLWEDKMRIFSRISRAGKRMDFKSRRTIRLLSPVDSFNCSTLSSLEMQISWSPSRVSFLTSGGFTAITVWTGDITTSPFFLKSLIWLRMSREVSWTPASIFDCISFDSIW